uniref:Mimecan n=1 Tax=Takifugu rubripes TaxID=31033 RepID=A0A674PLY6_TAKRU
MFSDIKHVFIVGDIQQCQAELNMRFCNHSLVPCSLFTSPEMNYCWVFSPNKSKLFELVSLIQNGANNTSAKNLPTCLLCVCLTGSVYCEEVLPLMMSVPTLPKETAYLYARFNMIEKISNGDFADIVTLKRIDLTGNQISEIEDGAFSKLTLLEDLNLSENRLVKLPMLPDKLTYFNANNNHLKTSGVKANAFKKMTKLRNLLLADNRLEAVPFIPDSVRIVHLQNNNITEVNVNTFCKSNDTYYLRPSLSEVRLDGNPVMLSKYHDSFTCMNVLPVGKYR